MIGAAEASSTEIYEAVVALSRSIAGRTDLRSLLSGVGESLRRIVRFNHLGMSLHDPNGNAMQGHILNAPSNPVITNLRLPVDEDPAGWVWLNQQPLVISPVQSETRWPEAVRVARDLGISTAVLVPLPAGNNRLGAFGFSSVAPLDPSPAELAFLERVAGEFAVAVEPFLAKQEAVRERDRLRTLFDITNALVARQIAIAVENALSYRQLRELKDRIDVAFSWSLPMPQMPARVSRPMGVGPGKTPSQHNAGRLLADASRLVGNPIPRATQVAHSS
jgi:GAF domain-containing protein